MVSVLKPPRMVNTYQGVEEDVEASSSVHYRKVHDPLELERSNLEPCVRTNFSIHSSRFVMKVMLLLGDL